jgi:3,4-dihydroxy-2-butanone 4-phosphate synthase
MTATTSIYLLLLQEYPHKDGFCFGRQSVEDAIAAIASGDMVFVVDDMDHENEGDFIMAADYGVLPKPWPRLFVLVVVSSVSLWRDHGWMNWPYRPNDT